MNHYEKHNKNYDSIILKTLVSESENDFSSYKPQWV